MIEWKKTDVGFVAELAGLTLSVRPDESDGTWSWSVTDDKARRGDHGYSHIATEEAAKAAAILAAQPEVFMRWAEYDASFLAVCEEVLGCNQCNEECARRDMCELCFNNMRSIARRMNDLLKSYNKAIDNGLARHGGKPVVEPTHDDEHKIAAEAAQQMRRADDATAEPV